MIPPFLRRVSRREADDYGRGFVDTVTIRESDDGAARLGRWMPRFWAVIAVKCVLVWWLMTRYRMPFSPLWVVAPTLLFAAVVTAVYYWRD